MEFFSALGFGWCRFRAASTRRISDLGVDVLIWDLATEKEERAKIEADPRLNTLRVMKDQRAVYIDGDLAYAFSPPSVPHGQTLPSRNAPGGHGSSMPVWHADGTMVAMRVTVDAAGRMVIPKPLRAALGIGPDAELEIVSDGGGLRLDLVEGAMRSVEEQDGVPLLTLVPGMVITDDDVRRLRDDGQR